MAKKKVDSESVVLRKFRYWDPNNIAKDFASAKERKAISAVFEWLSFNSGCALRIKKTGHYRTTFKVKDLRKLLEYDACVISRKSIEKAEKVLKIKKP